MLKLTILLILLFSANANAFDYCEQLTESADKLNADYGLMVDANTMNLGVALDCKTRTYNFKKKMLIPFSALAPGWKKRFQNEWDNIHCKQEDGWMWRRAISNGWTISSTIISSKDQYYHVKARCVK